MIPAPPGCPPSVYISTAAFAVPLGVWKAVLIELYCPPPMPRKFGYLFAIESGTK